MANPQIEDGYTKIANELLEALARTCIGGSEAQIIYAIIRLTYGWNKKEDSISISRLEDLTGVSRRMVIYSLQNLESKKMVVIVRKRGRGLKNEINTISLQKKYSLWVVQEKSSQYRKTLELRKESYKKSKELVVQENGGSARNSDLVVQEIVKKDGFLAPTKERKKDKRNTIPGNFLDFTKRFLEHQQQEYPTIIKTITDKSVESGAKVIEELVRIDKHDFETEIQPAIFWAVKDSFWKKNLLSLSTLRDRKKSGDVTKFDKILASYTRDKPKPKQPCFMDAY